MKFFDKILKRKEEKRKQSAREEQKEKVTLPHEPELFISPAASVRQPQHTKERLIANNVVTSRAIIAPHVTEKTAQGGTSQIYTFRVMSSANKTMIRQAVEGRYRVQVEKVRIVNMPGKIRRRGKQEGLKPGFKKAIVVIAKGQTIAFE